jgi:hypothetical protein
MFLGDRPDQANSTYHGRDGNSRVIIETLYLARPADMEHVKAYHLGKRVVIWRAWYEFDNPNDRWNSSDPFLVKEGFENCFTYPAASRGSQQIDAMRDWIGQAASMKWNDEWRGIPQGEREILVNGILERAEVRKFIELARKQLLGANWNSPETLHPEMFDQPNLVETLGDVLPRWMLAANKKHERLQFMNFLVAVDLVHEYQRVMRMLNISDDKLLHFSNPHALAFLVYDDRADAAKAFREASFDYWGAQHGLRAGPENRRLE